MSTPAAIALDLGSTAIKAALLNHDGSLQHTVSRHAPAILRDGTRFESDALAYADLADQVLSECLSHSDARPPLGLCSQRSSFVIWARDTGLPVTPLISWQDNRGAAACTALHPHEALIKERTGLRLTPYFLGPKLHTMLHENPTWRMRLAQREWLIGTLDTFLIWRWSHGRHYITDASMAARTLLLDIHTGNWSPELCGLFGVPVATLPQVLPSVGMNLPLDNELTLQASLGDQSAAFFASIHNTGDVLVNLGTGGFVMRALAQHVDALPAGYLRTLLYQDEYLHFALEGTINSVSTALSAYPSKACTAADLGSLPTLALAEPSGLGAPYFRPELTTRYSQPTDGLSPQQMAVLHLESILFRVTRIVEEFHQHAAVSRVFLSGGHSRLPVLQQGLAACLPHPVLLLPEKDEGLLGSGRLAAGLTAPDEMHGHAIEGTPSAALRQKYLHWKDWLDKLMSA